MAKTVRTAAALKMPAPERDVTIALLLIPGYSPSPRAGLHVRAIWLTKAKNRIT